MGNAFLLKTKNNTDTMGTKMSKITLKKAQKQYSDIMTKNISESSRRQKLIEFAKNIDACTRIPETDLAAGNQAEIIQHILTRFNMMALAEQSNFFSRTWIITLVSAVASVISAIAAWTAILIFNL